MSVERFSNMRGVFIHFVLGLWIMQSVDSRNTSKPNIVIMLMDDVSLILNYESLPWTAA